VYLREKTPFRRLRGALTVISFVSTVDDGDLYVVKLPRGTVVAILRGHLRLRIRKTRKKEK